MNKDIGKPIMNTMLKGTRFHKKNLAEKVLQTLNSGVFSFFHIKKIARFFDGNAERSAEK